MSSSHSEPLGQDIGRLARGAGIQLGGKFIGRACGFLAQVLLLRWLGPAAAGVYAIGLSLFLLAHLLASLGIDHGVIRFASRYHGRDETRLRAVLLLSLRVTLFSGLLWGGALLLAARPLADNVYRMPDLFSVLVVLSAGVVFAALLRVAAAGSRVSQQMHHSVLAEDLGQPVLFLLTVVAGWAAGLGLLAAVFGLVASYTLAALAALWLLALRYRGWLRARARDLNARQLLGFSVSAAGASILGLLSLWIDRLLVGYFLGDAQTGIYHSAALVSVVFVVVLSSFNAMFSPMIADLYHRGDLARLGRLFRISTKWGLYVCLPVLLVVLIFPRAVVTNMFDARFTAGMPAMIVLVCGQMANVASGAVAHLLIMSGHQNRWLLLSGVSVAANVLLNLLWIPRYGLLGAAAATALSMAGLMLAGLAAVRRHLGLWPWDRRYLKGLAAAAVTALALVALQLAWPQPDLPRLFAVCAVSAGVFVGALALLGFDDEDRYLLQMIRQRTTWATGRP